MPGPPDEPRTVIRPPPGGAPGGAAETTDVFARLARPLLSLADEAARAPEPDAKAIAIEARRRAEAFEEAALAARLAPATITAAREAILAVLDARLRANPALSPRAWTRASRRFLPGARPDADEIARVRAEAEARGATGRDLARFLRHCEEAARTTLPAQPRSEPPWGLILPLAVALVLAVWAGWAETRYARDLLTQMPPTGEALASAEDSPAEAARMLDAFRDATEEVEARAGRGPLGLAPLLGRYSPGAVARARYSEAADRLLPPLFTAALAEALATEGGSRETYDTLRARAILEGAQPWQPDFLAGWLESRAGADALIGRLAPHALALSGPPPVLPPFDPPLVAQAREIAAEGDPADFAFLELTRDAGARALPGWSATEIPGIAETLVSRTGRPLATPIPGLFTARGWEYARDGGARRAIERMRASWLGVTGTAAPAAIGEAEVLDRLDRATLDAWRAKLADLRVRPFTDRAGALIVSGQLSQSRSPLEALLRATWREVGGEDMSRPATARQRAGAAFGQAIQFLDANGMAEINRLFAGLNVTLQDTDDATGSALRRLMDMSARGASIAALNDAPRLVAQVVEDVLAQVTATSGEAGGPRAGARWSGALGPACRAAIDNWFPFAEGGADADLGTVAAFLGPDGALARFIAADLKPYLDTGATPWSWRPEARLSGFTPESAAFLERASWVGRALLPETGAGAPFTLAILAQTEPKAARVTLGGATAVLDEVSGAPSDFVWPGARPPEGFEVRANLDGTGSDGGRAAWPGPWGLLRFLDASHPRARDHGRRFLLDARAGNARIFLEMIFPGAGNLASARPALLGLACPRQL